MRNYNQNEDFRIQRKNDSTYGMNVMPRSRPASRPASGWNQSRSSASSMQQKDFMMYNATEDSRVHKLNDTILENQIQHMRNQSDSNAFLYSQETPEQTKVTQGTPINNFGTPINNYGTPVAQSSIGKTSIFTNEISCNNHKDKKTKNNDSHRNI